jgi:hypothetical protein
VINTPLHKARIGFYQTAAANVNWPVRLVHFKQVTQREKKREKKQKERKKKELGGFARHKKSIDIVRGLVGCRL